MHDLFRPAAPCASRSPLVSVLMVARNTAAFVDEALLSAREQTFRDIEIVFVDDGSTDATVQIAKAHADQDSRVRVLAGPQRGLSAVRNASLGAARGNFALVLDSDDLLHPRHVEWLVDAQRRHGHAVCAANMREFSVEGGRLHSSPFASGPLWQTAREIGVEEYLRRGALGDDDVSVGYFKPLFDLTFLRRNGLRYDERLRIGEDWDLVLRVLLAGGRMSYLPATTYFYRRHAASTSHRITAADCTALLAATLQYEKLAEPALLPLIAARRRNLESVLRHVWVVEALKQGRWPRALRLLAADREARALTWRSVVEGLARRAGWKRQDCMASSSIELIGTAHRHSLSALSEADVYADAVSPGTALVVPLAVG